MEYKLYKAFFTWAGVRGKETCLGLALSTTPELALSTIKNNLIDREDEIDRDIWDNLQIAELDVNDDYVICPNCRQIAYLLEDVPLEGKYDGKFFTACCGKASWELERIDPFLYFTTHATLNARQYLDEESIEHEEAERLTGRVNCLGEVEAGE